VRLRQRASALAAIVTRKAREWFWVVRLLVGLLIAFCTLACGAFSSVLIFAPPPKNPPLARCFGIVMVLVCIWVLSLGFRLITNRPNYGGLLSPLLLRLVAVYMVATPIFLIVTGRDTSWSLLQQLQAALSILGSAGIWRLVAWRKVMVQGVRSNISFEADGYAAAQFKR